MPKGWAVRQTDTFLSSIPKTPAKVGFRIGYDREEDTGAILVTDGDVTHYQIEAESSTRAKDWFINNAEKVMERYETTREKGIFVVTKTYTVQRRGVALLQSKEESLAFSLNVELQGVGKIAPEVGWWTSQKEQAWEIHDNVCRRRRLVSYFGRLPLLKNC
jgi:hypothetical protein